ncbi:hypothetical protein PA0161 [Candidatus Phytoplasma australiense]|uniref:Uncharacterized protein n=1 Tax=Phytoplasma australiense TaxID=59748 RepID=B1V964_PHYAS|nr:hypothetical protein PA0161 [Candidatus Phytoplasma australiense]
MISFIFNLLPNRSFFIPLFPPKEPISLGSFFFSSTLHPPTLFTKQTHLNSTTHKHTLSGLVIKTFIKLHPSRLPQSLFNKKTSFNTLSPQTTNKYPKHTTPPNLSWPTIHPYNHHPSRLTTIPLQ